MRRTSGTLGVSFFRHVIVMTFGKLTSIKYYTDATLFNTNTILILALRSITSSSVDILSSAVLLGQINCLNISVSTITPLKALSRDVASMQ